MRNREEDAHRTCYTLQDWHLKEIKESGRKKGDEVWFPHINDFKVRKGKIVKFDVSPDGEGELIVQVQWEEPYERHIRAGWTCKEGEENPKEETITVMEKHEHMVDFEYIANDFETAKQTLIDMLKRQIGTHRSSISYYQEKLNLVKGATNEQEG